MSITDILQETSKKYLNKSMVGDTVIHGVMIGVVVENNNKKFPGMVKVKIPTRDNKRNTLQWMKVVSIMGGKNWGSYCIPEINDEVLIAFENGNINNAYVIGSIFKNDSQLLTDSYTDENYKKVFLTKGKNQISVNDEQDKQSICIKTNNGHCVCLDDEKNLISLIHEKSKNFVKINTENGTIEVNAQSKLTIKINGIKLELIGDSGKVSLNCDSLNIQASQNISIDGQAVKIKSTSLDMSASTSAKLAADGITQIKGTVKLG